MTLGQLVDGKWITGWTERDDSGKFNRMPTLFPTPWQTIFPFLCTPFM